jgi:hypothetical protein
MMSDLMYSILAALQGVAIGFDYGLQEMAQKDTSFDNDE